MTEHSHKVSEQPEVSEIEIKESFNKTSVSGINLLALSIVLAAVLVSGSLFYSARLVIKGTGSGGATLNNTNNQAAQNQNAVAGNQVPSAPSEPSAPVKVADRAGQPVLGNSSAKVTIYEFSDFQCPYCEQFFSQTLGQIKSKYIDTGKVKLVYRNFPLSNLHQNAEKAAEAGECANRQGKFWEYHDLLFKNGKSDGTGLAVEDLKKYADQLGLNKGTLGFGTNKFNQCLDKGEAVDVVKQDQADGTAAGVSGTPTLFVNGKMIVGARPFANFEQAIDAALK